MTRDRAVVTPAIPAERILKYKSALLSLGLATACSIVIILIAGDLKFAALSIVAACLSGFVVNIFFDLFLRKETAEFLLSRVALSQQIKDSGIAGFYPRRKDVRLSDLAKEARQIIVIQGMTASNQISELQEELKNAVLRGTNVKVVIASKSNPIIALRARDRSYGSYDDGIEKTTKILRNIYGDICKNKPLAAANLSFFQYDKYVGGSIYRFDDKVFFTPYLAGPAGTDSPIWEFVNADESSPYTRLLKQLEVLAVPEAMTSLAPENLR
jgi:hypothetical protein